MSSRREFILGGAMLGAAGAALALTPRRKLSLLGGADLENMIPSSLPGWRQVQTDALVVPQSEDSLAAKLYSQTIGRIYINSNNEAVMMLIAFGDTQSDQLQLHRPEVCYPAFGFEVSGARPVSIPLTPAVSIPGRRLQATSDVRREQIMYWTRIGEYLPDSSRQQRWMRLRTEMSGVVADGVLARFSNVRPDAYSGLRLNQRFVADFVRESSPAARRALFGTSVAKGLAAWE